MILQFVQVVYRKLFGPILDTKFVLLTHTTLALDLYEKAILERNYMSRTMHFIFGEYWSKHNNIIWYKRMAVKLFKRTCKLAKLSMDMLALCLMRLGLYKDLRQFLVKLIWPNEIICWLQE